jgi:hypothetical protein
MPDNPVVGNTQVLARFTIELHVPNGLAEHTEDKLCDTLDLIDLGERLRQAAVHSTRVNSVLSRFITHVTCEE